MRTATSVPLEDGSGWVVFGVAGGWRLRLRTVALVTRGNRRRRVTRRRRLLRFAAALDAGALPAAVPGVREVVGPEPATRLPYGVLCGSRVALASLAAAARSTANS